MLDPTELLGPTDRREQELVVLYIIAVAGKRSEYAVNAMGKFMFRTENWHNPFHAILDLERYGRLDTLMRDCKLSPYVWKHKAFVHAAKTGVLHDLKTITPDEWANVGGEKVGIGPKSSRYICMCLDPQNARYAALDTHVLKWMRHLGYAAPKTTPPAGDKYNILERFFLEECDRRRRVPAELDLEIWTAYKEGRDIPQ